jgi:hypothetical protein
MRPSAPPPGSGSRDPIHPGEQAHSRHPADKAGW